MKNRLKEFDDYSPIQNCNPLLHKIKTFPKVASEVLNNILAKFIDIGAIPTVGVELEFYLRDISIFRQNVDIDIQSIPRVIEEINRYLVIRGFNCRVKPERGRNQYEIALPPIELIDYSSITDRNLLLDKMHQCFEHYIAEIDQLRRAIVNSASEHYTLALMDPYPFNDDYGSSLQINLALWSLKGINLFSANIDRDLIEYKNVDLEDASFCNILNSSVLLKAIKSLLKYMAASIPLIFDSEESFARIKSGYINDNDNGYSAYDQRLRDKNNSSNHDNRIENNGARLGFYAPRYINWGIDNRTTALRVPANGDRRIEFRVQNSSGDIRRSIIAVLFGALQGLINRSTDIALDDINPIYGNSNDDIYVDRLAPLPCCMSEALSAYFLLDMEKCLKEFFNLS